MLKLFGIQKSTESSKKSAQPDEEVDGFVILGETASERQHVPVEDVTGKCSQSTKEGPCPDKCVLRAEDWVVTICAASGKWTVNKFISSTNRWNMDCSADKTNDRKVSCNCRASQ